MKTEALRVLQEAGATYGALPDGTVTSLNMFGMKLGYYLMFWLRFLPRLRRLNLGHTDFVADSLWVLGSLQELSWLNLGGSSLDDNSIGYLKRLPRLRHLNLSDTSLTDRGLPQLRYCLEIRELHLSYLPLTDAGVRCLLYLPQLELLNLSETKITADGLAFVGALCRLRQLYLHHTPIRGCGCHLREALALTELDLSRTDLCDCGYDMPDRKARLVSGAELQRWRDDNRSAHDRDLNWLSKLPALRRLNLGSTVTGDAARVHLLKLPSLDFLNLSGTNVSCELALELKHHFPKAQIGHSSFCQRPDRPVSM